MPQRAAWGRMKLCVRRNLSGEATHLGTRGAGRLHAIVQGRLSKAAEQEQGTYAPTGHGCLLVPLTKPLTSKLAKLACCARLRRPLSAWRHF
eukprot:360002-Chlamydomonas_euryale.AAC.5